MLMIARATVRWVAVLLLLTLMFVVILTLGGLLIRSSGV